MNDTPYIPHSALGGDLINGWCGPCEVQAHAHFPGALPDAAYLAMFRGETAWVACFLSPDACGGDTLPRRNVCLTRGQNFSFDPTRCRMRLDPRREEVATRIATVLRARGFEVGPLLPWVLGGRVAGTMALTEPTCTHPGCDEATGHGGVHQMGNTRQIVTIPAADVSAVLLAASVAGVESGASAVRGVLGEWHKHGHTWVRTTYAGTLAWPSCHAGGWDIADYTPGGHRLPSLASGPETGPEGRKCADAALLRLGYAYLDTSAPFGVRVPTWEVIK